MVAMQLVQVLVQVQVQGGLVRVLVQMWVVVKKENLRGQDHNRGGNK
jgi:hypothetical protein